MNIYAAIKKDHKKVESLADRLVAASENGSDNWKKLIDQIRNELIPHSRLEEALFYNPIRETEHGKDLILHAYGEHAVAEADLRALQMAKAIDANWTALAKKFRDDLKHHVAEEESKVFAAARKVFSQDEADMIGETFESLKAEVRAQSFGGTTADLVLNLLPRFIRTKIQTITRDRKAKEETEKKAV